ncbi:MAG: sulfatase-like hydrolase/transferase [Fuerstiella sp.]
MRTTARFLIAVALSLPTLVAAASFAAAGEQPNIVLLMGDDHGWDETGYNGHPHLKTQVLDQMATSGLKLNRFYSAHPSCSPTRGSVMTGRHPNRYGTFAPGYSIRPEEITIAKLLHDAGYLCGHFGKWHLGPVKASSPTNPGAMGFEQWLSHDNFFELNPWFSRNGGPPEQFQGESSEIIIEQAVEFIKSARQSNKPFFTVVWFGSPHEPYSGLPEDLALYDNLPASYYEKQVSLTSNETGRPTKRPLDQVLRERYAEITAMDRSIGTLRQWLTDNQLRDNTLVWYCGDNGTSGDGIITSPFRGQKGNHYEGGVRVPGVIEWPQQIAASRTSDVNGVTSDILPTLCDVAGVPLPDRPLDGISLKPLITGDMKTRGEPIFFWTFNMKGDTQKKPYLDANLQSGTTPLVKKAGNLNTRNFTNFRHPEIKDSDRNGVRAILTDQYKLIVQGEGEKQKIELFDIRADAEETSDLMASNPDRADDLTQKLQAWQQSVLNSLTAADY